MNVFAYNVASSCYDRDIIMSSSNIIRQQQIRIQIKHINSNRLNCNFWLVSVMNIKPPFSWVSTFTKGACVLRVARARETIRHFVAHTIDTRITCTFFNIWRTEDDHLDDLLQDCSISSALAMEILQSCTKPSIWSFRFQCCMENHITSQRN